MNRNTLSVLISTKKTVVKTHSPSAGDPDKDIASTFVSVIPVAKLGTQIVQVREGFVLGVNEKLGNDF